jgi:branched-chain amino acid transport system ATP-binding protein
MTTAEPDSCLETTGIDVSFAGLVALTDVTLRLARGEILGLIGANGAGKTTLLRAISGIIPAEAGTIHYDGQDIVGMPPQDIVRAGLVQVPEGRRLFPDMTVLENLLVGSSAPAARRKRDENLAVVLDLFPKVRERKAQLAGTLSGGEQQMVAIARALMASPRLLLLDETSLGLAPIVVDEIFVAVRRLAEQGLTILVVEQNTALALEVADHGYVLEQGHFAIQGPASGLMADPRVRQAYLGI